MARIKDAIVEFLYQSPFIGYCLTNFCLNEIKDEKLMPTMGVRVQHGRVVLSYNPEYVGGLASEELLAVLEHELMHVLHYHMTRREYRDPLIFNIACDMVINKVITRKLPPGCLYPNKEWAKENLYAEWVYEQLMKNVKFVKCNKSCMQPGNGQGKKQPGGSGDGEEDKNGKGGEKGQGEGEKGQGKGKGKGTQDDPQECDGSGGCPQGSMVGDHSGWDSSDDAGVVEAVVRDMVDRAVQKSKGSIPGEYQDVVDKILKGKISWKNLVKYSMASKLRLNRETSWKVRNRRLLSVCPTFILPGSLRRRGCDVVIAVDTSGSIGQEEFAAFFGEMESLIRRLNATVTLIQCDAQVTSCEPYVKGAWKNIKIAGRGGTDFRPVIKYIDDNKIVTKMLIYFTDGMGDFPDKEPSKYSTLWVMTEKKSISPIGKTIFLDIERGS